jgi:hypothetical protein
VSIDQAASSPSPGRTEAFAQGRFGTPGDAASSLEEDAAVFNSKVPGQFTPHSVLQGLPGMSGNGMSAADAGRLLPGGTRMPSPNGSSDQS